MPFEIHRALLNDTTRLVEIEFAAYANSPDSMILRARNRHNIEHHVRAHRRYQELNREFNANTCNFYKIIDTDVEDEPIETPRVVYRLRDGRKGHEERGILPLTGHDERGKTIGWYRYEVFPEGVKTSVPLDHSFTEYEWPMVPKEHRAVVKQYWELMEQEKRRCLPRSRPHIKLCLIVIHPSYQRRGAGKQLLEHFCHEADRLRLPVFCQASPEGRALYEKFGFDVRSASHFPTDGIGIPGTRLLWNMVREPKPFVPKKATLGTRKADPDFDWMSVSKPADPRPFSIEQEAENECEMWKFGKVADPEQAAADV